MEDFSILNDMDTMKGIQSLIMAMGVGGAGGNAIEHMWKMNIEGVNLAACNTDLQDLEKLHIAKENRIVLGDGLGAGNIAATGADKALKSLDNIRNLFTARGTKMLFLAAGLGAGTGTGATPVIAELAQEMGILTVAIVTTPPSNDGPHRTEQAEAAIAKLRKYVDSLIILSNDAINELYGSQSMENAYEKANDIVAFAAKGIAEIITHKNNLVNVDFADVCTVMRNSGSAIMGVEIASGEDRAEKVVDKIVTSPLFGDTSISGSKNVLINISVPRSDALTLNEAHRVRDRVQHYAKTEDENGNTRLTNIIWGMSVKPNLSEDDMEVIVVATGFPKEATTDGPIIVKRDTTDAEPVKSIQVPLDPQAKTPTQRPPFVPPTPAARPAPAPLVRPSRNFAEIENMKSKPAYITRNVVFSTAVKARPNAASSEENNETTMPGLF